MISDRNLRIVPGYGTSLRTQLAAIGWSKSKLSSDSGVSRQTISRAINHDEVSERTKRTLVATPRHAPAERFVSTRHGVRLPTPVLGKTLCNASDLVAWSTETQELDRDPKYRILFGLVSPKILARSSRYER